MSGRLRSSTVIAALLVALPAAAGARPAHAGGAGAASEAKLACNFRRSDLVCVTHKEVRVSPRRPKHGRRPAVRPLAAPSTIVVLPHGHATLLLGHAASCDLVANAGATVIRTRYPATGNYLMTQFRGEARCIMATSKKVTVRANKSLTPRGLMGVEKKALQPIITGTSRKKGFIQFRIVVRPARRRVTIAVRRGQLSVGGQNARTLSAGSALHGKVIAGDRIVPTEETPATFGRGDRKSFDRQAESWYRLKVERGGTGGGAVRSKPSGIRCTGGGGEKCDERYASGNVVRLTAVPDEESMFAGWKGGGCPAAAARPTRGTCRVTMDSAKTVTAIFTASPPTPPPPPPQALPLTISQQGSGTGAIRSDPTGIDCGSTCEASFAPGTQVTLTATPTAGSSFAGWGGACSGTVLTCTVTLDAATVVTAFFTPPALPPQPCTLSGPVKHLIYVQFDNTHLLRDRPNVPSDLEQMPHLLSFMRGNGALLSNDHTVLVSHTANGVSTSLTGVYPDRHGQAVADGFRYFQPDGSTSTATSFAYWPDRIFDPATATPTDTSPNMVTEDGRNAPAPWVPFTRAGCDWGSVGMANTVLENAGPDVPKVFGADSPEAQEAKTDPGAAAADFLGVAVHCAVGSALCSDANHGRPDVLPDEPGGYAGFQALFGAKYVDAAISPSAPMTDLSGNVVRDAQGHAGFPGFDGLSASISLGYVAAMQEHGIPVTFTSVADAHDDHAGHRPFGPGEAGYVAQLRAYDQAFQAFFDRLAAHGITKANTLFVFTVDEGDHFVGGPPRNPGCDGVTSPCEYEHVACPSLTEASCPPSDVGVVGANVRGLLAARRGNTTPFSAHADMAPAFYLDGNPARDAPVTRTFERDVAALTAVNPYSGRSERIAKHMVDRVGMRLLHMLTGDPLRTPTFVAFAQPDWFVFAGDPACATAGPCVRVDPAFAWNHGGDDPEVATTWAGFVGPGVQHLGETSGIWTDHADLRPTILTLTGLEDDYLHDGRTITELLTQSALPASLRQPDAWLELLGREYKELTAPFGEVGQATIRASTNALGGDDATYTRIEDQLAALTAERDALAGRIRAVLEAVEFGGQPLTLPVATELVHGALEVIAEAQSIGASSGESG